MYFEYRCRNCEWEGTEVHQTVFVGHIASEVSKRAKEAKEFEKEEMKELNL